MKFNIHAAESTRIAELTGPGQQINELEDALDLLGNASYNGAQEIVVYKHQLHPDFFDLKTGLAGAILQKFSNYRMRLAIIGDFENSGSKSLGDFIFESNRHGQINFVKTLDDAIAVLK